MDRQLDRVHESRALAIQSRTLEVLNTVELAQPLIERGNSAVQLWLHGGNRSVPVQLYDIGLDDTAFPFLLFLSQAATEAVLNEHLAAKNVTVKRGVELVSVAAGTDAVVCTLRREQATEQVRARYLVGCDGAHSTVRELADILEVKWGWFPASSAVPQNVAVLNESTSVAGVEHFHRLLSDRGRSADATQTRSVRPRVDRRGRPAAGAYHPHQP